VDEILVNIVNDTVCVAHRRQIAWLAIELRLYEHPNRQRERGREHELAKDVNLVCGASALDPMALS
jgi:hypothetical protein